MAGELHHLVVSVGDMERSLELFRDILDFELVWRLPRVGGRKLSSLLGRPGFEAEMAYLLSRPGGWAVELVRPLHSTAVATSREEGLGLSLKVADIDEMHRRVLAGGWSPFTDPLPMLSPEGREVRVFCFTGLPGLMIELIGD